MKKLLIPCFFTFILNPLFSQEKQEDSTKIKTTNKLEEVIVSASRKNQKIKESPVSIEIVNSSSLINTASASYYDELENLKGVDINTNSLTFKSLNTRGFSTFANERFIQLVDGIDNSSPALNFVIGDFLAPDVLDVKSVEILPGASSALYGANAYNGLLSIETKNPFDYEGIDFVAKSGINVSDIGGSNNFYDFSLRMAKKFSDHFAAKASITLLKADDWIARDYEDDSNRNIDRSDPAFNGLNIYGDEVSVRLNFDDLASVPSGTFGSSVISRTGYKEEDLIDNDIENVRANLALHFKPFDSDFEVIWNSKFGRGNTVYHAFNRFAIRDFLLQHHKLEFKNKNFFVRSYFTKESAGNSYDSRFAAINLNNKWKDNEAWFTDYATGYLGAITGQITGVDPNDESIAHSFARSFADTGRLIPGTEEYKNAFRDVTRDPSLLTGSKFVDKSSLFHNDFNYNFSHLFEPIEIQIGSSFRRYSLDSDGTIFTDDKDSAINYSEFGVYLQANKKLIDDKLQLTGSMRYDKSENFKGNLSPRFSMVYNLDNNNKHYVRASFQKAFRNPTTQDQYIGLDIGNAILVGGVPDNLDRYNSRPITLSPNAAALGFGSSVILSGRDAYENSFTLESVEAFSESALTGNVDVSLLEQANISLLESEKISTFEIGYRGTIEKNIFLDSYIYYNTYNDFIRQETVITPNYGQSDLSDINPNLSVPNALIALQNEDITPFLVYTNSDFTINSYGAAIGINGSLNDFIYNANYTYAKVDFDTSDNNFQTRFNTPEHKVKVGVGYKNILPNLGTRVNWRWNDSYLWENDFAVDVLPARSNVDLQINYEWKKLSSLIKIGATNITGNNYFFAPGASQIGSQYYISWLIK